MQKPKSSNLLLSISNCFITNSGNAKIENNEFHKIYDLYYISSHSEQYYKGEEIELVLCNFEDQEFYIFIHNDLGTDKDINNYNLLITSCNI